MSLLLYKHLIILKTVKFPAVSSLRLTRSSIPDSVSTTAPERNPQPQESHRIHQRRFGMAVLTTLAAATLIVLTTTSARATTYYVATNGSSSNSGLDAAHPWNLEKTISMSTPGNTYLFANGTYTYWQIRLDDKFGSDASRIVWQSANKWGAVLKPNTPHQGLLFNNCTGVTVDGFDFDGRYVLNVGIAAWAGCSYVTVRNCKVHDCGQGGIGLSADNGLIENNIIFNNCNRSPVEAQGSGISVNGITMVNGDTFNGGWGVIVRGNMCYNNSLPVSMGGQTDGNGIIMDWNAPTNYTKQMLVENNISFNNSGRGIHVFQTNNVTIRNNAAYHNNRLLPAYTFKPGEISMEGTSGSSIYNNIMVADNDNESSLYLYNNGLAPVQNNIIIGLTNCYNGWTDLATNNQQFVNPGDVTTYQTYPQFINPTTDPASANFHTQTTSPAVDAGNNANAAAKDFDGVNRPVGATVDIGAYETTTGGATSYANLEIDLISNLIEVYPNPSTSIFHVIISNPFSGIAELDVFDLQGQKMMEKQYPVSLSSNQFSLDLSGFRKGMYFLNVRISGSELRKKIIRL